MKSDNLNTPEQLTEFQDFYSRYLRAAGETPLPASISPRRSRIYEELLFNNLCGFLDRCFPVTRKIMGETTWRDLNHRFYRDWQCHTPYFSRIPYEFVQYAQQMDISAEMPPWFAELLDYEWRELAVDTDPAIVPYDTGSLIDDSCVLAVNPTLQNLHYRWPVHRIGPTFIPEQEQPTFLLVFRNSEHQVRFVEVNALTSALIHILQQESATARIAIRQLAELTSVEEERLLEFGAPLLRDLHRQSAILSMPE